MDITLTSIETRAVEATRHPAFPVNLIDIRRNIALLLGEVGRYGFFDEYTTHSFAHVEQMLAAIEWIIPEKDKASLSDAECFILTISTYMHDLGLVITRSEYENRDTEAVNAFAENTLYNGDAGKDYRAKLKTLSDDARNRLIYQEFVRHNHGSRIRSWLEGKVPPGFGASEVVVNEIKSLIGRLSPPLRREIGKLCESHMLDDLSNIDKYKLSHPFGNSEQQTANIQYIALILRTADLLGFAEERAPSILLRVIDPTDPISQMEWHKQNAVTNVRRKTMTDQEGRMDESIESDTIEVFAHFNHAEGFFGLTAYLRYVESQLEQSFRIAEESRKKFKSAYAFPWRKVDEKNIEAEGFIPRQFGFELDQEKILTLLTGHTLYNDSTVVIRELVQNAIDAVRLQFQGNSPEENGHVRVEWDSVSGTLTVSDNGTGMTQDTVERHLLKVGSSRYQDEQFRKSNPNFNPISRFGIGVLTAFMVANSVEILTVTEEEPEARQISLRSVHGKYLIRLLDSSNDKTIAGIAPHGTSLKLSLRPSAKRADVLETVRRWIVFPRCNVTVKIDDEEPVRIGYSNPGQALQEYLDGPDGKLVTRGKEYRVIANNVGPLDVAFVITKNEFYNDWSLVNISDLRGRYELNGLPVGTCVEGIAVEFSSPGFSAPTIVALANATGRSAPRTNVARSALEDTKQHSDVIHLLYGEYFGQISREINRLANSPEYSLSWAIGQASFIAAPLTTLKGQRLNADAYDQALGKLPLFLLESGGERKGVSLDELRGRDSLWIVDSPLIRSVESLVKEAPTNITARSIIDLTHGPDWLPQGDTISGAAQYGLALDTIDGAFDIIELVAKESERRIDLRLGEKTPEKRWISEHDLLNSLEGVDVRSSYRLMDYFRERSRQRRHSAGMYYPVGQIRIEGLNDFGGVEALRGDYIMPDTGIAKLVLKLYQSDNFEDILTCAICGYFWSHLRNRQHVSENATTVNVDRMIKQVEGDLSLPGFDWDRVQEAVLTTNLRYFDPFAWSRREGGDGGLGFSF